VVALPFRSGSGVKAFLRPRAKNLRFFAFTSPEGLGWPLLVDWARYNHRNQSGNLPSCALAELNLLSSEEQSFGRLICNICRPRSETTVNPQMPTLSTGTRATESPADIQEQVRRRAFELYEQRGREDGHDLDDWLQAESELAPQYYAGLKILAYVEIP